MLLPTALIARRSDQRAGPDESAEARPDERAGDGCAGK
jgi:hypothetical protein